jgi:hypothetical protein
MTRTDLLNHLAEKYNLARYLEIGVQNPSQNFDSILSPIKVGVDPNPAILATTTGHIFMMTSDYFFENVVGSTNYTKQFDLIFIDGLHTAEQVKKDFENALKALSPNGFIVLHDCNPQKEEHTIVPRPRPTGHWNGDVYKFAASIPKYPRYTVDIDNGCMVVQPKHTYFEDDIDWTKHMTWLFFDTHRKELLNLISWEDFIAMQ